MVRCVFKVKLELADYINCLKRVNTPKGFLGGKEIYSNYLLFYNAKLLFTLSNERLDTYLM